MKILKELCNLLSGRPLRDIVKLKQSKKEQDSLFGKMLPKWKKDKELVVFFTDEKPSVSGGIMSIYNLCNSSRAFKKNVILMTLGDKTTHIKNDFFANEEKIFRFQQLFEILDYLDSLTLNIPECWVDKFNNLISDKYAEKLKHIKNLHINILNQNIDLMPDVLEIQKLKKLTANITQTTAHSAYATQEFADKYGIITHFLGTYSDFSKYKPVPFDSKEKIIALSPDKNEYREEIIDMLRRNFPDFKFIRIKGLTYEKYIALVTKSMAVITFGEGFDGYFLEAPKIGTLSCAVYNDRFFPSLEWKSMPMVYESYESLKANISNDLKSCFNNQDLYYKIVGESKNCKYNIDQKDVFVDNMKRFYEEKYDYFPQDKREKHG